MRRRFLLRAVLLVCVLVVVFFVVGMVSMPGQPYSGPIAPQDEVAKVLRSDVTHLAVDIGERNIVNRPEQLKVTAAWLEERLHSLGYDVTSQSFDAGAHEVRNLIVERRGTSDEIVIIGAHYDTAPGTPGADDNGSGVAVALSLADFFAKTDSTRTIRFIFFTNEEPPFFNMPQMGSEVAAKASRATNENIVAMLSLETMGYFSDEKNTQHYPWPFSMFYPSTGNFIAFVADTSSRDLAHEVISTFRANAKIPSDGASVPARVPGIGWSDHGAYWRYGFKALMVTDTAPFRNPNYHHASDLPDTLDFTRLAHVALGLRDVVANLANAAGVE